MPIKSLRSVFTRSKNPKTQQRYEVPLSALVTQSSCEKIIQNEMVNDPLKAAPDLPFGFLHEKWEDFAATIKSDDEIWEFTDVKQNVFHGMTEDHISGYVRVKNSQTFGYLITKIETRVTAKAKGVLANANHPSKT